MSPNPGYIDHDPAIRGMRRFYCPVCQTAYPADSVHATLDYVEDMDEDPFINERTGRRDDDLADPGKPTQAAPMWQLWLQVSILVVLGGLVILSQVFR